MLQKNARRGVPTEWKSWQEPNSWSGVISAKVLAVERKKVDQAGGAPVQGWELTTSESYLAMTDEIYPIGAGAQLPKIQVFLGFADGIAILKTVDNLEPALRK